MLYAMSCLNCEYINIVQRRVCRLKCYVVDKSRAPFYAMYFGSIVICLRSLTAVAGGEWARSVCGIGIVWHMYKVRACASAGGKS